MTKALWFALALVAAEIGSTAMAAAPASPVCGPVEKARRYPTFCEIPATPKDVRPAPAFKAVVVETRRAGARMESSLSSQAASLPIGGAESFASQMRAEATPPRIETPPLSDTRTFETQARERLAPPKRPRP